MGTEPLPGTAVTAACRDVLECFLHLQLFWLAGSKMVLQGPRLVEPGCVSDSVV